MKSRARKRRLVRWSWQALRKAAANPQPEAPDEACLYKLDLCRSLTRIRVRTPVGAIPHAAQLGITGFGFGVKITGGKATPGRCIRVYVSRKKPTRRLTRRELVPKMVNGLPTDVIEMPGARPTAVFGGDYVSYKNLTTGTFGCVVKRGNSFFILSNNHVLANVNAGAPNDDIIWRDPATGVGVRIATLDSFVELAFSTGSKNTMDAAIARILNPAQISPQIQEIGRIAPGIATAFAGQVVTKYGGATGLTSGVMEGYREDFSLEYDGRTAVFQDQLAIKSVGMVFTDDGDSGSLVLASDTHQPVGLHFASDLLAGLSFCTPIEPVLKAFQARLVT